MAAEDRLRRVARGAIESAGAAPDEWSNGPHAAYPPHRHGYRKLLFCVAGEITFHLSDGDVVLRPGDRLDLPAGTRHAATVGAHGVTCIEGAVE
jgi:quercetin dioxygenase-like cupin family protein